MYIKLSNVCKTLQQYTQKRYYKSLDSENEYILLIYGTLQYYFHLEQSTPACLVVEFKRKQMEAVSI